MFKTGDWVSKCGGMMGIRTAVGNKVTDSASGFCRPQGGEQGGGGEGEMGASSCVNGGLPPSCNRGRSASRFQLGYNTLPNKKPCSKYVNK